MTGPEGGMATMPLSCPAVHMGHYTSPQWGRETEGYSTHSAALWRLLYPTSRDS